MFKVTVEVKGGGDRAHSPNLSRVARDAELRNKTWKDAEEAVLVVVPVAHQLFEALRAERRPS